MNFKTEITKLHYDKNAKPVRLLDFCALFYGAGSALRNWLYDRGFLKAVKVNAFVISVGNITTGGVGKTPVVAEIVKYLAAKGEKAAIVSRGYGGKRNGRYPRVITPDTADAPDEPLWLAQNTGAVVVTSPNRVKAARYAIENFGVTKIIMDDGFQHRKLHRDLDIVLTDSKTGFGNEKLLPAGPLRESLQGLKRADKILKVSKGFDKSADCYMEPDSVYNIKTGAALRRGAEVTAICAIGRPQQFFDLLKDYDLARQISFDDHHRYELKDVAGISGIIVTTEKDAVKLRKFDLDNIYALKLKTHLDVEALLNG